MSIFKRLFKKKKQTTVTLVPVTPATIVDFDPTNIQILVFGSCTSGRNILRNQWCYEYDPAQIPSITNEAQVRLLAVETVIDHGRRIFYETKSLTGDNWVCKCNKLTQQETFKKFDYLFSRCGRVDDDYTQHSFAEGIFEQLRLVLQLPGFEYIRSDPFAENYTCERLVQAVFCNKEFSTEDRVIMKQKYSENICFTTDTGVRVKVAKSGAFFYTNWRRREQLEHVFPIFTASLISMNQKYRSDVRSLLSGMHASMEDWERLLKDFDNNAIGTRLSIVFTHIDLFMKHFALLDIAGVYPDYKRMSPTRTLYFIINKYLSFVKGKKFVSVHVVDATNHVACMELFDQILELRAMHTEIDVTFKYVRIAERLMERPFSQLFCDVNVISR